MYNTISFKESLSPRIPGWHAKDPVYIILFNAIRRYFFLHDAIFISYRIRALFTQKRFAVHALVSLFAFASTAHSAQHPK